MSGRRGPDWLRASLDPHERDGRRGADRRAPQRGLDPLFAATLINQIRPAPALTALAGKDAYRATPQPVEKRAHGGWIA
ncbi:MAG: hypothetical protein AB7J28_07125 [Hyphomonadaceae bacterium]